MNALPCRIVCLSAEAADWLWRIGAWDRVAGVTAYFDLPPQASWRPRVSGFSSARYDEIEALEPDLLIAFSDVQAGMAGELIRRGLPVLTTNPRSLADVEDTLALLARAVGCETAAAPLLDEFRSRLAPVSVPAIRPRVYFEEWHEPLVSGIRWVSELIERAGGEDVFPEMRTGRSASERRVNPADVFRRNPEVILASWCGRPVNVDAVRTRPGWEAITAVRTGHIHEIPAEEILQPGFRLVEGYERIKQLVADAPARQS